MLKIFRPNPVSDASVTSGNERILISVVHNKNLDKDIINISFCNIEDNWGPIYYSDTIENFKKHLLKEKDNLDDCW